MRQSDTTEALEKERVLSSMQRQLQYVRHVQSYKVPGSLQWWVLEHDAQGLLEMAETYRTTNKYTIAISNSTRMR